MARRCYPFLLAFVITCTIVSPLWAIPCKFVTYNLNNYSLEGNDTLPAKSPASLSAIEAILSKLQPDILAVSEMGSRKDLSYLQRKLKNAGMDLPYTIWIDAPDPSRHLALLSRFPIERNDSRQSVPTTLSDHFVKRGILDVTLRLEPEYTLRLVGAHLKSQRPTPSGSLKSNRMRLAEAQALASHIAQILRSSPHSNLLVFGDFNDRPTSSTLKTVSQSGSRPFLFDLAPADHQGERWTYYFAKDDIYSRFDYLLVAPGLAPEIAEMGISDSPHWNLASDHRPLYLIISTILQPLN